MAATIYISPFMDFWDNVFSVTSMAGVRRLLHIGMHGTLLLHRSVVTDTPVLCCSAHAVLWLVVMTGEMMKWAHFNAFVVNAIAGAHIALTSGVSAIIFGTVAWQVSRLGLKVRGDDQSARVHLFQLMVLVPCRTWGTTQLLPDATRRKARMSGQIARTFWTVPRASSGNGSQGASTRLLTKQQQKQ